MGGGYQKNYKLKITLFFYHPLGENEENPNIKKLTLIHENF
jgi:hypothetical protein